MKRIILSILAICVMSALANAESCTSVGATDKKYTPEGECSYKTQTRTCCENGNWSDWDKGCDNKQVCEEGEEKMESMDVWGNGSGPLGKKWCKGVCKDNKMKFTFDHMECLNGLQAMNDSRGYDGVICANMKVKEVRVKEKSTEKTPEGKTPGLFAGIENILRDGARCQEHDQNLYARLPDSEQYHANATRYYICVKHNKLVDWFSSTYYVEEVDIPLEWTYTLPAGCIKDVGGGMGTVYMREGKGAVCGVEDSGTCLNLSSGDMYINEPGTNGTKRGRGWLERTWWMCDIEGPSTLGEDERCSDNDY